LLKLLQLVLYGFFLAICHCEFTLGALEIYFEVLELLFKLIPLRIGFSELELDLVEFFFQVKIIWSRLVLVASPTFLPFLKTLNFVFQLSKFFLKSLILLFTFFQLIHSGFQCFFIEIFVFLMLFLCLFYLCLQLLKICIVRWPFSCGLGRLLRRPNVFQIINLTLFNCMILFFSSFGRPQHSIVVTIVRSKDWLLLARRSYRLLLLLHVLLLCWLHVTHLLVCLM